MKRFRKIRRFFNLVEVSLALGVAAVGVVGAMTILPYAMRTTQQTMNDTYLCDVAEMIFTEIDRVLEAQQKNKSDVPEAGETKSPKQKAFEN